MEKLLLHVCCGPCAIEPFRILSQKYDCSILYSNDNIYPKEEFDLRKNTLLHWAKNENIEVITDQYDYFENNLPMGKYRCSKCYEHRIKKSAIYASTHNFKYLSSSLAVSPYQHNNILNIKLQEICRLYNLIPVFMDFRPYYKNAVSKSIELNMYRQKYCGCKQSLDERNKILTQKKKNAYMQEQESLKSKRRKQKIQAEKTKRKKILKDYRNKTTNL